MPEIKPRNPAVALTLSANIPGLGQMYNGQLSKAVLQIAGGTAAVAGLFEAGLFHGVRGMLWELVLIGAIYIYIMTDSYFSAVRRQDYALKKYNQWYYYIAFSMFFIAVCLVIFLPLALHHCPLSLYKIPSESMKPALLPGDIILVEKSAYEFKNPKRWDMVVFHCPGEKEKTCVKRVIAAPWDMLEIRFRSLFIDGRPVKDPFAHYQTPLDQTSIAMRNQSIPPMTLPRDKYFVMGDNREHSRDSRNYGLVDRSAFRGKPLVIVFSLDWKRIGNLAR